MKPAGQVEKRPWVSPTGQVEKSAPTPQGVESSGLGCSTPFRVGWKRGGLFRGFHPRLFTFFPFGEAFSTIGDDVWTIGDDVWTIGDDE